MDPSVKEGIESESESELDSSAEANGSSMEDSADDPELEESSDAGFPELAFADHAA